MDNAINNNGDEILAETDESSENEFDKVNLEKTEDNSEMQTESDEQEPGEETPPKKKIIERIKEQFIAI